MLVLTRRQQEQLLIGDNITLTIVRIDGNRVKVSIDAPPEVKVLRGEVVRREGRAA